MSRNYDLTKLTIDTKKRYEKKRTTSCLRIVYKVTLILPVGIGNSELLE